MGGQTADTGGRPLVSIIMATYNRSNILRSAIRSVIDQTMTDWEMQVVGDACTDDTAEVVTRFAHARVRFENLPRNFGEQSEPNNHGLRGARGPLIDSGTTTTYGSRTISRRS